MKKRILLIFLVLILIPVTTYYLYYCTNLVQDGIWNYGFGYNIVNGLVPYKDFNMIIPPLYPYVLALFLIVLGKNLLGYYIFISILLGLIFIVSYQKLGFKGLIIYLTVLFSPHNGYNVLSALLMFVLLYQLDKDKKSDIIVAIIISLMVLTKQTLGLLIIPNIIYSKDKKKTICIYLIAFFLLLLYLVINNNLFEFIDYCFLGMLEFNDNKTSFNIYSVMEIAVILYLLEEIIRLKQNREYLIYILLFQIIVYPIVDCAHFVITIVPVFYYILKNYKFFSFIFISIIISCLIGNTVANNAKDVQLPYKNKESFMYNKKMPAYIKTYFNDVKFYTNKYKDHRVYILDPIAYTIKLELDKPIDKYDLINNGNMRYKGEYKYIDEIDENCSNNKCLFFVVNEYALMPLNQTNRSIIRYVDSKYFKVLSTGGYNIYVN